ncbi:phage tail protein [Sporosarcina saromensis]|uniref:Phage tail protein n=1 Tax=Sporosarcina saromensis TaxID=359365 RepID=A0ABU4G5F6_9BACL|nr:phage tail protein [Sporosarcina saromensis]MDW0112206.1 phage tail protein [Sporosarcina saromensis]
MVAQVVTEFDPTDITEASIQFKTSSGTYDPGKPFGCVGSLSGEGENFTIEKKCGQRTMKSKTKTSKLNMTLSGHIPLAVARDIFGLTNKDLKPGIWAAGTLTKGKDFILTVTAVDEFEDNKKLMAFPNSSNTAGFKIQPLESGVEEVAMLEIQFSSLADELNFFYYEAIVAELEDPTIETKWHTAFNRELVEVVPGP